MGLKGITINTPATEEPHILAEDDAAIYQAVFGGDCVFDIGGRMNATVLSNNKVRVGDGVICVGGHVARNIYGDYEELVIENGTSGMKRNDLIVAKFTSTGPGGVDTFSLEVKKGTAGTAASDPVVTKGNLYEGASLREFPLYRVKIEGLSITAVEQLFTVRKTNEQLENEVTELNGNMGGMKYKVYDIPPNTRNWTKGFNSAMVIDVDYAKIKSIDAVLYSTAVAFALPLPPINTGGTYDVSFAVFMRITTDGALSIFCGGEWSGYGLHVVVGYVD